MQQVTLILLRSGYWSSRRSIVTSGIIHFRSKSVLFNILSARDRETSYLSNVSVRFIVRIFNVQLSMPTIHRGNTKRSRRTQAKRQVVPGVVNKVSVSMKTLTTRSRNFCLLPSRLSFVNITIPSNLWNPSYFSDFYYSPRIFPAVTKILHLFNP